MENNDKNIKKNFLIYSLSGMFFKGSSSNDEPETTLTESEISENLFGGSKLGSLSLLPEMMGLSEEDAEKMGFVEEVLVYFSADQSQIWNYNPIISVHLDQPVYSNILVFVTPSMMKGFKGNDVLDYKVFNNIVQTFVNTSKQYIESNFGQEESDKDFEEEMEKGEESIPRSSVYKISDIKFCLGSTPVHVEYEDIDELDAFFAENFSEKYHPDLYFRFSKSFDCTTKKKSFCTCLYKPGMLMIVNESTGVIENYFMPQFTQKLYDEFNERIFKVYKKYKNSKPSMDSKAKEKAFKKDRQLEVMKLFKEMSS